MTTLLNDPIIVGVIFHRGTIKPAWFIRRGRRYVLREVTMRWQTREGSAAILHLGVSDGATDFELAFNQQTLQWSLVSTTVDGCE